jgi:hypothetical protein
MVSKSYPAAASADDKRYRAEDALRTLQRAEEIRQDAPLMREVERCRQEQMKALARVKVETSKPSKTR